MEDSQDRNIHFLDYWRVIRSRKEIILAVTLLVVITATVFTYTRPKIYQSTVRIEVRQDSLDLPVFQREVVPSYNPFFMRTQYEIIRSRDILQQVIQALNLNQVWGEEYSRDGEALPVETTLRLLKRQIRVNPYRDTTLIDIEVYDRIPEYSARIANAVAVAYRDRRLKSKSDELRRALQVLQTELDKQMELVSKAEEHLESVRREFDISTLGTTGQGGILVDSIRLQKLVADRIEAEVDYQVRKARLDGVLQLSDEELVEANPWITRDNTLSSLKQSLINSKVQLRVVMEEKGPAHPEVRQLAAGVDELQKSMDSAILGLKQGLQIDYQVAEQKFKQLDEILKEVRQQDIEDKGERLLPFEKANREVEMQRQVMNALRARLAQEGIEIEIPRTPVDIIEMAMPPDVDDPYSPNYLFNIAISICIGLGLGLGMAYFIEYLDTSVKTVDDVEQYLGLPVIGIIPQKVRPLSQEGPDSPHGEAYRLLRTNIQFNNKGVGGGAFAVVSGGVGEGKSTTLFNLAYVCAQLGDKVLVVDSDLRRPVQHTFLDMSNRFGLTNVLMRDVALEETIKTTNIPNLHFLPSGQLPRAGLGLLDSQRMRDLVKNLKTRYDYVFFDAPPLMGVSDASILASEVDGVLLVVQYRKYPRTMSARAKRVVENVGGKILGVVLNNINIMRDDYYYYYHTHYTHYYGAPSSGDSTADEGQKKKQKVAVADGQEEVY